MLPTERHDERVGDSIEAFLEGPPVRAGRPSRKKRPRPDLLRAVRRPVPMDTRTDWEIALRHEDARVARYHRPAAVLVIRVRMDGSAAADRYAARVGAVVREHARDTDRVTRAGPDRIHVLMPETTEAEAMTLAARVRDGCADLLPGRPGIELEILAATASPSRGRTLHDALRLAQDGVTDEELAG